jgi:hypothetical protein
MGEIFKSISIGLGYSLLEFSNIKVLRNQSVISQILLISFLFSLSHVLAASSPVSLFFLLFTHGTLFFVDGLTHFAKFGDSGNLIECGSFLE